MAFSLKKRSRSKSQACLITDNQNKSLGEVLHRSTKTKKKDKDVFYQKDRISSTADSDLESNIQPTSIKTPVIYRNKCLCDTHHEKQLVEHTYDLTVDRLFDLLFGSNEFVRTYRQAQQFYDDTATEWSKNEITNNRERILTYKVPYESTLIGKSTIVTREKQTLFHEIPGSHYMLETEVSNEGVRYSDTFSLTMRYCLVQMSSTTTNLRVTAQITYTKALNRFIKQIIERNAYSASQEGLKDLNNRLNLIANFKMEQRGLNITETISTVPTTESVCPPNEQSILPVQQQQILSPDTHTNTQSSDADKLIYMILFLVGILIFIHIHLAIKLKHVVGLVDNIARLLNNKKII
ncbi:unnamed protein product [Adineta steineri]|uniref:VASt domain-containing protein n=1 Tax=Adineta steineri TaxID=433720 RepID=A0A814BNQ8_9BILA|nr:unnamed protein product [Adineta steineri]CAF3622340.1 unnamed protein product [Adineta steineri]